MHIHPHWLLLLNFLNENLSEKLCPINPFFRSIHLPKTVFNRTNFFGFLAVSAILQIVLCSVKSFKISVLLMTPFFCPVVVHWLRRHNFSLRLFFQIANQWVYWVYALFSYFHSCVLYLLRSSNRTC